MKQRSEKHPILIKNAAIILCTVLVCNLHPPFVWLCYGQNVLGFTNVCQNDCKYSSLDEKIGINDRDGLGDGDR
jgi:hypothetical protein